MKNEIITVLKTDKKFIDSPETGLPECVCSRCGIMIEKEEIPLRLFSAKGKILSYEYRYCEFCYSGKRFEEDNLFDSLEADFLPYGINELDI